MSRDASTPLALLVCSLSLALILYGVLLYRDRDLEFIRSEIPGQYHTPLLNIRKSPATQAGRPDKSMHPTVLLVHGLSASKSVMIHLGTQFAKWGMNSYLVDLPGHGESNEKFSWTSCQSAVQEALTYLKTASTRGPSGDGPSLAPPVFLVGHSIGAALVVQAARSDADVAGVIAVSPAAVQVERAAPRGILILLGEFDLPSVRSGALFLFQQATGISTEDLEGLQAQSSSDGLKRVVMLPWTEHSLGIFAPRALFEMAAWLQHSYPGIDLVDTKDSLTGFLLRLFVCSFLSYSLVPGFDLLHRGISLLDVRRSGIVKDEPAARQVDADPFPIRGSGRLNRLTPLWLYGLAGILAVVLLLAFNPWDRLHLMGGGYLCGFLCLTGMLALCWQQPRRTIWFCSWVDLIAVLLSVTFFVCLAGPLFSRLLVHLTMSQTRFWRYPIIAVSIYPFFLFDEWVSRRVITYSNFGQLVYFHFSTRLLLALILILGFFLLQNGQFLIVLILPALLILSSLCWFQTRGVYGRTQSVAASAASGTILTAWFLSTFFVQL